MSDSRFLETVHEYGGFRVILHNQGNRPKPTAHRYRHPNPGNEKVECAMDGCSETHRRQTGYCGDHDTNANKFAEHPVDWVAELRYSGEDDSPLNDSVLTHLEITRRLIDWAGDDPDRLETLDTFVLTRVEEDLLTGVPDATALQADLDNGTDRRLRKYLESCRDAVEATFVADGWTEDTLSIPSRNGSGTVALPVPVAAALYYMAIFCEEANQGDTWYLENGDWDHTLAMNKSRAGGYMPLGFYLLLRHSDASIEAAEQVVQSGYR